MVGCRECQRQGAETGDSGRTVTYIDGLESAQLLQPPCLPDRERAVGVQLGFMQGSAAVTRFCGDYASLASEICDAAFDIRASRMYRGLSPSASEPESSQTLMCET